MRRIVLLLCCLLVACGSPVTSPTPEAPAALAPPAPPAPAPPPQPAPPPDTTPPTVTLIAAQTTVQAPGEVTISAKAQDNVGVTLLELLLDGRVFGTSSGGTFSKAMAFGATDVGLHVLTARAQDAAGNVGSAPEVALTITPPPPPAPPPVIDTTPPTVSLSAPASVVVPGVVDVTITASDAGGIDHVDLLRAGSVVATLKSAPYTIRLPVTNSDLGTLVLSARAVDTAGNVGTSTSVSVTVTPPPDTTAPTVGLSVAQLPPDTFAPATLTATVSAQDDRGVTQLELLMDGQVVGRSSASTATFAVAVARAGTVTMTARASDAAGNIGTSSAVTTMVPARGQPLWFVGDSLTEGAGSSSWATTYPARVQALLADGRSVALTAQGGSGSTIIAALAGAYSLILDVPAGRAPAGEQTEVVPSIRLLNGAGDRGTDVLVGGVIAKLFHRNTNDDGSLNPGQPYYLLPSSALTGQTFDLLVPQGDHPSRTALIWVGRNNIYQPAQIVADVQAILRTLTTDHYLVLSIINGDGEGTGAIVYSSIRQANDALTAAFSGHYLDVRAALTAGTPDDTVPATLRRDNIHLNDSGYDRVAQTVAARIRLSGY